MSDKYLKAIICDAASRAERECELEHGPDYLEDVWKETKVALTYDAMTLLEKMNCVRGDSGETAEDDVMDLIEKFFKNEFTSDYIRFN